MKFALTQSLFWDVFVKRNSNILKIVWIETTLPKTGLAPVGPVRLLGVKAKDGYWEPINLHNLWNKSVTKHKQDYTSNPHFKWNKNKLH